MVWCESSGDVGNTVNVNICAFMLVDPLESASCCDAFKYISQIIGFTRVR